MALTPTLPHRIRTRRDLEALLVAATNYEEKRPPLAGVDPFKLDRVERFLAALGDPQRGPVTVHVAGSKGKGTTSRLLAAALGAAGRGPVGLYTSPHLEDLSDRIVIDGTRASDAEMVAAADRLLPYVRRTSGTTDAPTFFEIMTAVAWLVFRARACAAVVLETGLGGRLDATNVCAPRATVITTIELEHTWILGDTVEAIAAEKAGILKPGVPAATGATDGALATIREAARAVGAPLAVLGEDLVVEAATVGPGPCTRIAVRRGGARFEATLPVAGVHHATNAALAWWAARELSLSDDAIARGFAAAHLPGILELLPDADVPVVIDGAHTGHSAAATRVAADAAWPGRPRVLLLALLEGKDPARVLRPLLDGATAVVTTTLATPRTVEAADLATVVRALAPALPVEALPDRPAALARARSLARARASEGAYVLAVGSVRLAGWVRAAGVRRPPGDLA